MIIRKREVFSHEYVPHEIFHRENEINTIKHVVNAFLRGVKTHAYCYGLQGTGKTAVSKFLNKKLNEHTNSIYVDAKSVSSRLSLLAEISRTFEFPLPSRGISIDEFFARTRGRAKPIIIFLDEADSFKDKDFLYSLAKSDFKVMFVFISNIPLITFLSKLSGTTATVEFKRYNPFQLKDILNYRAKIGLRDNSYNEEIISKIAGFAAKHKSNARAGIMLLFHSALIAEERGDDVIRIEDVEHAKSILLDNLISHDLSSLSNEKRVILEALMNSQYLTIDEISKLIPSKSSRMVRHYVDELVEQGYVIEEKIALNRTIKKIYRIKLKL